MAGNGAGIRWADDDDKRVTSDHTAHTEAALLHADSGMPPVAGPLPSVGPTNGHDDPVKQPRQIHSIAYRTGTLDRQLVAVLEALDLDGSGTIGIAEIKAAADRLSFERGVRKGLTIGAVVLVAALLLLVGVTFGVTLAAAQLSRELETDGDVLVSHSGGVVSTGAGAVAVTPRATTDAAFAASALVPDGTFAVAAFVKGDFVARACAIRAAGHTALTITVGEGAGFFRYPTSTLRDVCVARAANETDVSLFAAPSQSDLGLSCQPDGTQDASCAVLARRPAAAAGRRRRLTADFESLAARARTVASGTVERTFYLALPTDKREFYDCEDWVPQNTHQVDDDDGSGSDSDSDDEDDVTELQCARSAFLEIQGGDYPYVFADTMLENALSPGCSEEDKKGCRGDAASLTGHEVAASAPATHAEYLLRANRALNARPVLRVTFPAADAVAEPSRYTNACNDLPAMFSGLLIVAQRPSKGSRPAPVFDSGALSKRPSRLRTYEMSAYAWAEQDKELRRPAFVHAGIRDGCHSFDIGDATRVQATYAYFDLVGEGGLSATDHFTLVFRGGADAGTAWDNMVAIEQRLLGLQERRQKEQECADKQKD
ncbi:unnamed protein product [Pedinophyceae sp. YPF-701]|nr:unnamed protein product [Pedinophyceae sp. YPF-701]